MSQIAWILAVLAVTVGIWLIIRAWRQFEHPESLDLPGVSVLVRLSRILQPDSDATHRDELWSNPTVVRLVATAYMGVGTLPIWLLIFRLVSL
jgi:hypothetical protein